MQRNLKAVLFDMDGVLVDVSGSYRRAIQETAAHFTGRDVAPHTIQRYKNQGGFNDDWTLTHAIIRDASMEVPLSRVIDEFQRRYRGDNWNGFIAGETQLIDGEILGRICINQRVVGIVTGRPEAEARWTMERFGWRQFFPLLVAMEKHQGRGKPDPYPLQHALAACEAAGRLIAPDEAVYIGDSVDDVVAARAAGMWSIGIVPPYLSPPDAHADLLRSRGAHFVLTEPAQLPDLIDDFFGELGRNGSS